MRLRLYSSTSMLFLLLSLALLLPPALSKDFKPQKSDLPLIGCGVCERLVTALVNEANKERKAGSKGIKELKPSQVSAFSGGRSLSDGLSEYDINEIVDELCLPLTERGRWISLLDILEVPSDDKKGTFRLDLVEQDERGKCEVECQTIATSCHSLLEHEIDVDGLIAKVWRNKTSLEDLKKDICVSESGRCSAVQRQKALAPGSRVDYPFIPTTESQARREAAQKEVEEQEEKEYIDTFPGLKNSPKFDF